MRRGNCTIFRPKSLTHVRMVDFCHLGLSSEQLGVVAVDVAGFLHGLFQTAISGAVCDGATHGDSPAV